MCDICKKKKNRFLKCNNHFNIKSTVVSPALQGRLHLSTLTFNFPHIPSPISPFLAIMTPECPSLDPPYIHFHDIISAAFSSIY